jgi:hypothetical protein
MGFCPEATVYVLEFEGTELAGLTAKMAGLTVAEYGQLIRLVSVSGSDEGAAEANDKIIEMVAESLISWNMEDKKGNPVPPTLDGVQSQESRHILRLFTAWYKAMNEIGDDLEKGSSSGGTTLEESLGLGTQSTALPSGLKAS